MRNTKTKSAKNLILGIFSRCKAGYRFDMPTLTERVQRSNPNVAYDSVARILRDLRSTDVIDYTVTDRANSKYKLTMPPA